MATASVTITPECSICFEYLKKPKILPCGHTFCLGCVERYISDRTDTFPCPVCQQDIKIPEGGARMFTTNFIVPAYPNKTSPTAHVTGTTSPTTHQTDKTSSNVKYHCLCHRKRPIEYYCLTCHCVLCHKCSLKEHNGHEFLDEECETTKDKATQLVLASDKFIQNKIKDLEETHVALVEAREKLQRFTEDACSRITKQTDKIIADIKASRERIMTDIKNKSEESQSKMTETDEKIMADIKQFKLNLESNFPSLTEDCNLQILVSLEELKKLEELCKDVKVETPSVVPYRDWEEKDFSLNIDMFGSTVLKRYPIPKLQESTVVKQYHIPKLHKSTVLKEDHIPKLQESTVLKEDQIPKLHESMVLKQYHIPKLHESTVLKEDQIPKLQESNSYQFYFYINDIKNECEWYYSQDKFSYSNLVWSCSVMRSCGRFLYINYKLLPEDNPKLDYCIIDSTISVVNIDDSKTRTNTFSNVKLEAERWSSLWDSITWSELTDKNNGYLDYNNQFVIQFDISHIREISFV